MNTLEIKLLFLFLLFIAFHEAAAGALEDELFTAVKNNSQQRVQKLISMGADVNFFNLSGDTPLNYASIHNQDDMVVILRNAGAEFCEQKRNTLSEKDCISRESCFANCRKIETAVKFYEMSVRKRYKIIKPARATDLIGKIGKYLEGGKIPSCSSGCSYWYYPATGVRCVIHGDPDS